MSAHLDNTPAQPLTFRRYKDGDDKPPLAGRDLRRRPFAQVPHLHPEHAALPGQLPVGRGHPRLPQHRARHREAARRVPWQEYAWRRLTEANPLPSVMGRVCPAPCESGCNRNQVEDFVGINSVEHFLGEYAIENKLAFPKPTKPPARRWP
jgi:hypothetical protein